MEVYEYRPREVRGTLLFLHGGGWMLYDPGVYSELCADLAYQARLRVVAPDYPKAPEAPYPGPVDCVLALYDTLTREGPVLLAGDSAGANLAFSLAAYAEAGSLPPPAAICSWYGVFDPSRSGPSHQEFATGFGMTSERLRMLWSAYAGDKGERSAFSADTLNLTFANAFPLRLVVAEADPARSDTELLAQHLERQGFDVDRTEMRGTLHGCLLYAHRIAAARAELTAASAWLEGHARKNRAGCR